MIVSGDLHVEFWTDQETGELRSSFKVNADEVSLDMRALSGVTYRNRSFQGPQPQPNVGKIDGQWQQDGQEGGTPPQQRPAQARHPAPEAAYGDDAFGTDAPPDFLNDVPPQGEPAIPQDSTAGNGKPAGKSGGKTKKTATKPQANAPDDDFLVQGGSCT